MPFTHFRPAFTVYPKLSNEIQVITGQVMTGQATPAQGVATYNKYLAQRRRQKRGRSSAVSAGVPTSGPPLPLEIDQFECKTVCPWSYNRALRDRRARSGLVGGPRWRSFKRRT